MPTPKAELYQAINNVLREAIIFNYYDIDLGQLDKEGAHLPMDYPAALMSFDEIIWRGEDVQLGVVTITVKLIFQLKNETEMVLVPPEGRSEVIEILATIEAVNNSLSSLTGGGFNKLRRFNEYQLPINPKDFLWINVVQYQCNIKSDGEDPGSTLDLDYDNVKNNNAFMERKKYNLLKN